MDLVGRLVPRRATCDGESFRPGPILHRRSGLDSARCCGELCSFVLHCWGPAATPRSCAAKGVHKQHSPRRCPGAAQPCSTTPPAPLTALTAFVRAGAAHGLRALACPRARASRMLCKHDRPRDPPLRMAAGRLESGHVTGAAAWKRAEQQVELHSGAGAVARVGLHDAVPAGHGRQCGSCSHGCSAQGGCMRV